MRRVDCVVSQVAYSALFWAWHSKCHFLCYIFVSVFGFRFSSFDFRTRVMMLLIEFCLVAAAVVGALAYPALASNGFEACERAFGKLAQKPRTSVILVGLAALAARAALLPIIPIPHPAGHDEFGYLLLADTFAHGRLSNPTHPLWIHFESIHILWQPAYCAKFFPAQGLTMAAGQAIMGHPFWGVWLSTGLMCAAICWMLQGWLPLEWALLGGFLAMIRLGTFSYWANSYWGGTVAATSGAMVLGALPRIWRTPRVRYSLILGLGLAVLANSRPYEGLFLGLPVAAALVAWILGKNRPPLNLIARRVAAPLFVMLVLTAAAMGYYFWRTTGHPSLAPYVAYERTYSPAPNFPWQPLRVVPAYHHAEFQDFYAAVVRSYRESRTLKGFIGHRIGLAVSMASFYLGPALALPLLAVLAMLPYGFSWRGLSRNTRFLALVCATVIIGCMLPIWFSPHYVAPITSAILALVLVAMRRLRTLEWRRRPAGLFLVRAVPLICLSMLVLRTGAQPLHIPEPRRWLAPAPFPSWCSLGPGLEERAKVLASLERLPGRHLVIVHYGPHHPFDLHEWVYNDADLESAKVIWARDMGPARNTELLNCFSDRHAWVVHADESPPSLIPYVTPPLR